MNYPAAPHPAIERRRPMSAVQLGVVLFVGAAVMLFVGLVSTFVIIRYSTFNFKGMPPPPSSGAAAELFALVVVIAALGVAAGASRDRVGRRLRAALAIALVVGISFPVLILLHWNVAAGAGITPSSSVRAGLFYMLTTMHLLHVIGGCVPLGIWLVRAWRRPYEWLEASSLRAAGLYWRFVAVVGVVLVLILYVI